jgi:GNAT superfamily N-acetyltransferase
MPVTRLSPVDDDAIRACHDLMEAALRADDPAEPPESPRSFKASLFGGWSGSPVEAWHLPDSEFGTAAAYRIEFPDLDNPHWAFADIVVRPERRRAGLGAALLLHAAERAAASERTLLGSRVLEGSPGESFAAHAGAIFGGSDVRRVQQLRAVPGETLDELRESAAKAAAGYSLAYWEGITRTRESRPTGGGATRLPPCTTPPASWRRCRPSPWTRLSRRGATRRSPW